MNFALYSLVQFGVISQVSVYWTSHFYTARWLEAQCIVIDPVCLFVCVFVVLWVCYHDIHITLLIIIRPLRYA